MPRLKHSHLIKQMQSLNYPCGNDGVCRGVAMMGIQSFLVGELAQFNERLHFLAGHEIQSNVPFDSLSKRSLNEAEQQSVDIRAFFDGIYLYQEPLKCSAYLGSSVTQLNTEVISKVTQSIQLERKNGLVKAISWPGIYDDGELEKYVEFLNETANKINRSFSLLIESDNHCAAILYDRVAAIWYVLDANKLPAVPKDTTQLAVWIKKALFECGEMTVFESAIYLAGEADDVVQQFKDSIEQSPVFVSLHAITERKINACNSRDVTLAFMAAKNGHADVVKALYESGAYLGKANKNGETPVFVAALKGHVDVIKVLHEAGVDLNPIINGGMTPVLAAAQNGHVNAVKVFHEAGVDLNQNKDDGTTLVFIAAQNDHVNVIEMLLDAGVDLTQARIDGVTPAFIAAQNGHVDVIKVLHKAGVNLNQARKDGVTPAVIAAFLNKPDVLAALEAANVDLAVRTSFGTPLDNAIKSGSADCINFLTDYVKRKPVQHSHRLFGSQDGLQAGVVKVPLRKLAPRNYSY